MSDYYESEIEPIFGVDFNVSKKKIMENNNEMREEINKVKNFGKNLNEGMRDDKIVEYVIRQLNNMITNSTYGVRLEAGNDGGDNLYIQEYRNGGYIKVEDLKIFLNEIKRVSGKNF